MTSAVFLDNRKTDVICPAKPATQQSVGKSAIVLSGLDKKQGGANLYLSYSTHRHPEKHEKNTNANRHTIVSVLEQNASLITILLKFQTK